MTTYAYKVLQNTFFFFAFGVFLKNNFIGVYLIYNIGLLSGVQQSGPVIHIHIYSLFSFRFFSHIGQKRALIRVSCAIQQQVLIS